LAWSVRSAASSTFVPEPSARAGGGVKTDNIAEIAAAGADTFVAGSAIFGKPDYKAVIDEMRQQLAQVG